MTDFLTTAAACLITYVVISRIEHLWNTYTRYKREQAAFERTIVVAETMFPWCKLFFQQITEEQLARQITLIRADVTECAVRLLDLVHDKMRHTQHQSRVFEDIARQFPELLKILWVPRSSATSGPGGLGSDPTTI